MVTRCRGRIWNGTRCTRTVSTGLRCWQHPAASELAGLPRLQSSGMSLDQLRRYAIEFDAISEGERYRAAEFAEWLRLEVVEATG